MASQNASFPLESVTVEGTLVPQAVVLEMADLRLAAPIDKDGIEQACRKLQQTGLFASISYRYAPGRNKGFALALTLTDQAPLMPAAIDVPGVNEDEVWQWLRARFGRFDRQVPEADAAQQFLAAEIERHIGGGMRGQRLETRLESDLATRKTTLSFQPAALPCIQSITFTGNSAVPAGVLDSALNKVVAGSGYTERRFAAAIEYNLRPAYEARGFYRARFVPRVLQRSNEEVSLGVDIAEGAPYKLRNVELAGENLPVAQLMALAGFPKGKLANWKQIQEGLWEMEKALKRAGYFTAAATPERSYDDAAHLLDLRIQVRTGPLHHFGRLLVTGLSPLLEGRARKLWEMKPGDPYDYAYPQDFFQTFSRSVDFRTFRRYDALVQKGTGEHVIDVNLVFETQ